MTTLSNSRICHAPIVTIFSHSGYSHFFSNIRITLRLSIADNHLISSGVYTSMQNPVISPVFHQLKGKLKIFQNWKFLTCTIFLVSYLSSPSTFERIYQIFFLVSCFTNGCLLGHSLVDQQTNKNDTKNVQIHKELLEIRQLKYYNQEV